MSTKRTHQTNAARLPVRLPAPLLAEMSGHAAARGETRSEFVRRAVRLQLSRDRVQDRDRAARAAFANGVFIDAQKGDEA
jgi:metal-responsive CopG/Arc/MetJ family transcriptional regulator